LVQKAGDKAEADQAYEGDHKRIFKIFDWCKSCGPCILLGQNPNDQSNSELVTPSVYAAKKARINAEAATLRAQRVRAGHGYK
jgi:hypothetical protein